MSNLVETIKNKPFFDSYNGVSETEINKAETELSLKFTDEYKQYLIAFGEASYNGHELTGICQAKRLNVIEATVQEKENNTNVPLTWYVVEQLNIDDVVIWQAPTGEIYQTIPGEEPHKLCNSLLEYVNL